MDRPTPAVGPFLNFVLIEHPEEKPRSRSTGLLRFHGGTSDGSGGPLAVTIKLTTIGWVRSLASASVGALFFETLPSSYRLQHSLMVSSSAVQVPSTPKTQAPVLPEPGLFHLRAWRASHSSRHGIELTSRLVQYVSGFNAMYVNFVMIVLAILVVIFSIWGSHQLK